MDPSVATTSSPSWANYCQPGQGASGGGHFSFAQADGAPPAKMSRLQERPCDLAKRTVLVYRPQASQMTQSEPEFFRSWLKANFNVANDAVHEVKVIGVENYRVAMVLLDDQKTLDNVYDMYTSSSQQFARISCYIQKATDTLLEGATLLSKEAQAFAPATSSADGDGAITDVEQSINMLLVDSGQLSAAYGKAAPQSLPTTPHAAAGSIPPTPFSAPVLNFADAADLNMLQAMLQQFQTPK